MDEEKQEQSPLQESFQSLPRLNSAASQCIEKDYKSGATYKGTIHKNMRSGRGVFIWPNGAKYEGEFVDNQRHGEGFQQWADGSCYCGKFDNDMRHGKGKHEWANQETYEGEFFRDRRHGEGIYTWPNNSFYKGTFYMDKKEGYGCFTFVNQNKFEGLYKCDERQGPGVLTYSDGRQDVGLWHREKLIKLCVSASGAFTMKDHPEFDYNIDDIVKTVDIEEIQNQTDVLEYVINPPQEFDYPPQVNISTQAKCIFKDSLHTGSVALNMRLFDDAFFNTNNCQNDDNSKIKTDNIESPKSQNDNSVNKLIVRNSTPSSILMQMHIHKHKNGQKVAKFDVDQVLRGERKSFGPPGPIEEASEEFLQAAVMGDINKIKHNLECNNVHVDIADNSGHTALVGAAVHWHGDIINYLLDNGANVNKLNDEGMSALATCHVYFYPTDSFKYNIAEKYLVKPDDFEQEKGFDVNDTVKSINSASQSLSTKIRSYKQAKPSASFSSQRIKKLRQEYQASTRKSDNMQNEQNIKENAKKDGQADSTRQLGVLKIKRVPKTDIDEVMAYEDLPDYDYIIDEERKGAETLSDMADWESETEIQDFESAKSVRNLPINVTDQLIERCATQLSNNQLVVGRARSAASDPSMLGTVRQLAIDKSQHVLMESTIRLLLKRGADPNASNIPMPVLFFAIKSADVDAVRLLLMKGASTTTTLSEKKGGLTPLHIAAAIPGPEGVAITELLLDSLASPNAQSSMDDSFLNRTLEEEWSKDPINEYSRSISGGRTPLHIACARDDSYANSCRVVRLLLQHHANPNLICNGHSALTLAIVSGNDSAINALLLHGADPCLPLTHGVGNALCVASSTEYENRRTPDARLQLIDKLIKNGADILSPIPIGPKRILGSAVDYAYHMYNLDRRIAHMPYHALTHAERETFNARRRLLAHMGDILRTKAVKRERIRLEDEEGQGKRSLSPSTNFIYTGSGASPPADYRKKSSKPTEGKVGFRNVAAKKKKVPTATLR